VKPYRVAASVFLGLFFAIPLAAPFVEILSGMKRLPTLAWTTFVLAGSAAALAVPFGTIAGFLIFRTDLPLARLFRAVAIWALFVPLALVTSAWQAALGAGGLLPAAWWGQAEGRPWAEGLGPAIWIHAAAALPCVTLIVGRGLLLVDAELEEDALLTGNAWHALWSVTMPRAWGAVLAAAAWVILQTAGDITVTNVLAVPTVAEEVLSSFQEGGGDPLARALVAALPVTAVTGLCVFCLLRSADRLVPDLAAQQRNPRRLGLMRWRWFWAIAMLAALGFLVGVPLVSLVWKSGAVGYPPVWSVVRTSEQVLNSLGKEWPLLAKSTGTALANAVLTASCGLVLLWAASSSRILRNVLFVVAAGAWALPGPVVGIGLKEVIISVVSAIDWRPLTVVLYEGPASPVPVLWAHLVRFLPCTVMVFCPIMRQIPADLLETARLDGRGPAGEFWQVVWPCAYPGWTALVVVLAGLSLGEVSTMSASVETPGWQMFSHVLFNRMHYGVAPDVSSLGLALLVVITLLIAGIAAWKTYWQRGSPPAA
jgi:iron(III) transport system permease protein